MILKFPLFQSHLRLIHPIHLSQMRSFGHRFMFQSHLRLIHPIHHRAVAHVIIKSDVSIASAPHPPYPLTSIEYVKR